MYLALLAGRGGLSYQVQTKGGITAREIRRKGEKKEAKLRLQMLNPVKFAYIGEKDLDRGCAFKR